MFEFSFNVSSYPTGCSKETITILNQTSADPSVNFAVDINVTMQSETADIDAGKWEDIPDNMKDDDAFMHAFRDIQKVKYVISWINQILCNLISSFIAPERGNTSRQSRGPIDDKRKRSRGPQSLRIWLARCANTCIHLVLVLR